MKKRAASVNRRRPQANRYWPLDKNLDSYVKVWDEDGDDAIVVRVDYQRFWLSRPEARRLAKQLNDCLDATTHLRGVRAQP